MISATNVTFELLLIMNWFHVNIQSSFHKSLGEVETNMNIWFVDNELVHIQKSEIFQHKIGIFVIWYISESAPHVLYDILCPKSWLKSRIWHFWDSVISVLVKYVWVFISYQDCRFQFFTSYSWITIGREVHTHSHTLLLFKFILGRCEIKRSFQNQQ